MPFPHIQFMAQGVPPPQIFTMLRGRHATTDRNPNLNVLFMHL